ncbi:NAD-dependent epimerase/dehydratase family protein [Hyphomicrobium sp.]|uniref:NAD-dependent epimerase/dehydratase family protein n=1 Tax=Hyphomicrobium sp. TaxID=82 RepID=UPI002FDD2E3A
MTQTRRAGRTRCKPVIITGGAGFLGSNLAHRLLRMETPVLIIDSLARPGVERNLDELKRLKSRHLSIHIADIRDESAAQAVGEASAVVHLAAQVAVTASISDPITDFEVNTVGTLRMLEAARRCSDPPTLLLASTNKVYGDLSNLSLVRARTAYLPFDAAIRTFGIGETWPLSFRTPYGCSKGAADQYVLDYARTLGLPAAVFRMSCIYGPRQLGTEDQGWVAHFLNRGLEEQPITLFGDGKQVRDILFVDDAVETYARALAAPQAVTGRAFNLGGGPANAVSLNEVLSFIEGVIGRPLTIMHADWRPGDQLYYVSDTRSIRNALKLPAPTPWKSGVAKLARWLVEQGPASRHEPVAVGGAA